MNTLNGRYQRLLAQAAKMRQRVRKLHAKGVSQKEIAKRERITKQRVSQILNGA